MTYKKPFDGCFAAPLPPHIDLSNHDIYDVKVTIYPAPRELMGILSVMTESTGMSVTDVVPPPPPKHMKCQLAAPQGKTKEDAMVYLEELLNNWAEHSRKPVDEGGGVRVWLWPFVKSPP